MKVAAFFFFCVFFFFVAKTRLSEKEKKPTRAHATEK
jgi:hypothetical protein